MQSNKQIIDGSFEISYVERTGSTNADLVGLAKRENNLRAEDTGSSAIAKNPLLARVLVADYQTAGRGRKNRSWHSEPKASLLASLLIYPPFLQEAAQLSEQAQLSRQAQLSEQAQQGLYFLNASLALSALSACEELSGVTPQIKWPNDLVIQENLVIQEKSESEARSRKENKGKNKSGQKTQYKKLAGILSEITNNALIMGIGINLKTPKLPSASAQQANQLQPVGLNEMAGAPIDRNLLLEKMLVNFKSRYLSLEANGFQSSALMPALIQEVSSHSAILGKQVMVVVAGEEEVDRKIKIEGKAAGFTHYGQLILKTPKGEKILSEGDVASLR